MKKIVKMLFLFVFAIGFSQEEIEQVDVQDEMSPEELTRIIDSVNSTFTYQRNIIKLNSNVATLKVPNGYKYLDAEQSKRVLSDLWGNPPSETLGMLFPEDANPLGETLTYAVEITYSEEGFIDDEDAADIDYDDLLEDIQKDTEAESKDRVSKGYEAISLVGWASPPYYDQENKKLHWAKEYTFEGYDVNTLNYNIRVLGRKGYLNLNVIGDIDVLPQVKDNVNDILGSVSFNNGYKYAEFNPDVDEVAAYGIGGLIAGKVLAKVGFFALILKFWKFIAIGAVALFAGFKKRLFGDKTDA